MKTKIIMLIVTLSILACGVTLPVPAIVNTYAEPYRRATLATAPQVEIERVQMDRVEQSGKMQEWKP